jgi:hypothetical protein
MQIVSTRDKRDVGMSWNRVANLWALWPLKIPDRFEDDDHPSMAGDFTETVSNLNAITKTRFVDFAATDPGW